MLLLLKENPFFVLHVGLASDRKMIAEKAEEMGFLLDADICSEAQSQLTNPAKRLDAELTWFPETQDNEIESIRESIIGGQLINASGLMGYSKLNALIYNLGITSYTTVFELGFDIVGIDEQYNSIELPQTMDVINQAREKAGLTPVDNHELLDSHKTVLEEIRRTINEKLKVYDEQTYMEFATVIAEKYMADNRCNAGPVLFDIIDQYEIRMLSEIENRANQIIKYVDQIKEESSESVIRKEVPKVVGKVMDWDTYARPLQLRSKATGLPHELSRKLAYAIRGLIIGLNNEKKMTSEAKDLASAMKSSFLDLGEFEELFSKDTETLKQLEKDNEKNIRTKTIETLLAALENDNKYLLYTGDAHKIKAYCDQVILINKAIKDVRFDAQQEYRLRTRLCFSARNAALSTDNKKIDQYDSKYVLLVLHDQFQDISYLKDKLQADLKANR